MNKQITDRFDKIDACIEKIDELGKEINDIIKNERRYEKWQQ